MPCYPALALLIGSAMDSENSWVRGGTRALAVISAAAAATVIGIYWKVRHLPAPGDIASALSRTPAPTGSRWATCLISLSLRSRTYERHCYWQEPRFFWARFGRLAPVRLGRPWPSPA